MHKQTNRKAVGDRAESLACDYLTRQGLQLVQRNYRCRGGEIDLVMQHDDSLVFVEVRYRRNTHFGRAAETVTADKQRKLLHCARVYLQRQRLWHLPTRFDVVSIEGAGDELTIHWIDNAFQASA